MKVCTDGWMYIRNMFTWKLIKIRSKWTTKKDGLKDDQQMGTYMHDEERNKFLHENN